MVYTFTPQDQAPVYYEAPAFTVNTPATRIDYTMQDMLRDIRRGK